MTSSPDAVVLLGQVCELEVERERAHQPALLAAVFLAWTQALTWMPYGLRGVRVIVTVLWLMSLDTVVLLAMHFKVSEPVMLAILLPLEVANFRTK